MDERVNLLLGPDEPELTCEECFEALDEHVERELEGREGAKAPRMHAHLRGCPACREDYESLRDLVSSER